MQHHVRPMALIASALLLGYLLILFMRASLISDMLLFAVSLFALVKSADIFTRLATDLGNRLGISRLATGILIIAIGTSAPELFASVGAALQGQPEIVVGNVLGTIIANSLLGIGCGAIVASTALKVHHSVFGTQMSLFLVAILLALGSLYDGILVWYEGLILLIVLGFYLHYVMRHSGAPEPDTHGIPDESVEPADMSPPVAWLIPLLLISLAALFLSGDLVVTALIQGAATLDISSTKLATSILAVGTSIPEIATAIALVRQHNADGLFGEIIGSNIFDVLGIFGIIALFTPLTLAADLLLYLSGSVFLMFIITMMIMNDREINRLEGVSLIALFSLFTLQLVNL
ncbi:MAG: sodium:calcium antiporter [Pseudomonadota bacterium]